MLFTGVADMAQPFVPPVPEAPGVWEVHHGAPWRAGGALCLSASTAGVD